MSGCERIGAIQYGVLQNIITVHLDGHLTTPDGRPDGVMDERTTGG